MSGRPPRDRRFLSYVVVLLLLAAFAWSLLRACTIVQEHRRNDAAAPLRNDESTGRLSTSSCSAPSAS